MKVKTAKKLMRGLFSLLVWISSPPKYAVPLSFVDDDLAQKT